MTMGINVFYIQLRYCHLTESAIQLLHITAFYFTVLYIRDDGLDLDSMIPRTDPLK